MYKHTFYYFLGNKKYPEIYILPFWQYRASGSSSGDDSCRIKILHCREALLNLVSCSHNPENGNCEMLKLRSVVVDVDKYCSFSLLVEMSSVRTLKGPSSQIRCINRIKGCHQCKFFQEIQSFTGIKRCHQHQSFPGLEMRFGETLFNLIHAPQTNVQIFSGTDIH